MADANMQAVGQGTTQAFLQRLTHRSGASVGDALKTCCSNDHSGYPYSHSYDRIGFTGGFNPQPTLGNLLLNPQPSWVGSNTNFHKPVLVSFDFILLPCTPPAPMPSPTPTPWWPNPSPNPSYPVSDCGVAALVNYKNAFGRRCSAVESSSGQCMFDYRSTAG